MKEGHTMTDEELIDALGTDLGLSWDMVFCEDKGAAVRDAAREYLAARSAKEEAGKKLIGLAMATPHEVGAPAILRSPSPSTLRSLFLF
jgi:hypothetical protein